MNKFFINKQSGIRPSATSSGWRILVGLLVVAISLLGSFSTAVAKDTKAKTATQTYTQPLQNTTMSLSGQAVETSSYFIKVDYWRMKHATLNLNYQVSQLADRQLSDITVAVNGTKFYSFRPVAQSGLQTKQITIPLRLLRSSNSLKISGQILTRDGKHDYRLAQTPANWLTVDARSNVNCEYTLKQPNANVNSFYDHFSGPDTVVNQQSAIEVPAQASNAELTASMSALAGEARVITTETQQIPVTTLTDRTAQRADYQVIVATYDHLPARFKRHVSAQAVTKQAVIKRYDAQGKHYLIVTAPTGDLLIKAGRYVANAELMQETAHPSEIVRADSQTFTSSLNYDGHYQLTTTADRLVGANHQERSYFVSLPVDRNNADGSTIKVSLRYAKNLDFRSALATVYINDTAIGSHKLTARRADNDSFTVKLPKGLALGNSFTVRIALDLPVQTAANSTNAQTPWASIEPSSRANIQSAPGNDLLFSNYPNLFLQNSTYDHLAVVRPKTMTLADYRTLSSLFNLIGNYARSNQGQITFYQDRPSQQVLTHDNVIALGTPQQNAFIRALNDKLYFQFDAAGTRLISNEKLSIEPRYGATLGTAQLLRSPYNAKKGLLVITGATPDDAARAAGQISNQKNVAQYTGDAVVVDRDNLHRGYRFKKNKLIDTQVNLSQRVHRNRQLLVYLGIALGIIVILLIAILMLLNKHGVLHRSRRGKPHA